MGRGVGLEEAQRLEEHRAPGQQGVEGNCRLPSAPTSELVKSLRWGEEQTLASQQG